MTVSPTPTNYAWYLRTEFRAVHKRVRGIPVKRINADWCRATEYTKSMIPPEDLLIAGRDAMADSGLSFAVDGFLDRSSKQQTALVGVYETCAGEKGGFLLILDKSSVFTGKIRFLSAYPAEQPFAALKVLPDGALLVMSCMDCDGISELEWDQAKNSFVWRPGPDEATEQ